MKDSQRPDHVILANMVGHLREGRYMPPISSVTLIEN